MQNTAKNNSDKSFKNTWELECNGHKHVLAHTDHSHARQIFL